MDFWRGQLLVLVSFSLLDLFDYIILRLFDDNMVAFLQVSLIRLQAIFCFKLFQINGSTCSLGSSLAKGRDHPLLHCELGFSTPVNLYVYGVELPFSKNLGAGDPSQTGRAANVL